MPSTRQSHKCNAVTSIIDQPPPLFDDCYFVKQGHSKHPACEFSVGIDSLSIQFISGISV